MSKAAYILVVGDPGPFRRELLLHREIDVLWAATPLEAATMLRTAQLDGCIVSPEFEHTDAPRVFLPFLEGIPCIALVTSGARTPPWCEGENARVVSVEQVDSLVALLAHSTGLRFARFPRAGVDIEVTVSIGDTIFRRRSIDLSLSGVAVRDFPPAAVGTSVDIELSLGAHRIAVTGSVVRWFDHAGERSAGLSFVQITEVQRSTIARALSEQLQWQPGQRLQYEDLFGDLHLDTRSWTDALSTRDVGASPLPATLSNIDEKELRIVCEVSEGRTPDEPAYGWLIRLVKRLTRVEVAAARGDVVPAWAQRALNIRIQLARARAGLHEECIPSALLDEAYRVFVSLRDAAAGESGSMVFQVGRIRAALLREIVKAHPAARPLAPHVREDLDAPVPQLMLD